MYVLGPLNENSFTYIFVGLCNLLLPFVQEPRERR